MAQQLVPDALVEQAMSETGFREFDNASYREGLDVFLASFNEGIAKGWMREGGIARDQGMSGKTLAELDERHGVDPERHPAPGEKQRPDEP